MKNIILLLVTFIALSTNAQVVSGLYSGTIYNDSTKMLQQYEVALSEYKGKITGYSYTTYVVNDTFYYGIRHIKAAKKEGHLVIEDDKFIVNNFPESPSKGVRRSSSIPLAKVDTITALNGRWQTNRTKNYYSVAGSVDMKRDNDSSQSALINHLKELKIIGNNYQEVQEVKIKTKGKEQKIKIESKTEIGKIKPASIQAITAPIPYLQRKNKQLPAIEVASDSIDISFYDNGVVDGDIISVYLNGDKVIASTRLTEAAVKKTIYLDKIDTESIQITLVAENLGSLPPNTGLLVVEDGGKKYNVQFNADLGTNATIIFRKRK